MHPNCKFNKIILIVFDRSSYYSLRIIIKAYKIQYRLPSKFKDASVMLRESSFFLKQNIKNQIGKLAAGYYGLVARWKYLASLIINYWSVSVSVSVSVNEMF